jgi:hypothetical protein
VRSVKPLKGQAILEYTLLLVFVVLIFAYTFGVVRRSLFNIWICQLYPRIASIGGCAGTNTSQCWAEIIGAGGGEIGQCKN